MQSRTERAWAAGFFDGEGNVYTTTVTPKKHATQIQVRVQQNEPSTLERFRDAVVVGRVKGPYERPYRSLHRDGYPAVNNPIWYYQASTFHDVMIVREALWEFLSQPKRIQFGEAIRKRDEMRKLLRKHGVILRTPD